MPRAVVQTVTDQKVSEQKPKVEAEPTRVAVQEESAPGSERDWMLEDYSGQLSVDVYQTEKEIVIVSTVAGVRPEDIDIAINNDMVTIRGRREREQEVADDEYLYQECYWGGFSRSIILPTDVKADRAQANFKNGVLTIRLPKIVKTHNVKVIKVKDEE